MCGHGNHGDGAQLRLLSHPRSQRKSVLIAKLDIQQHPVRRSFFDGSRCRVQVLNVADLVTFRLEPVAKQFAVQRVVFDHEDAVSHAFSTAPGETTRSSCLTSASCQGCCFWRSISEWVRK